MRAVNSVMMDMVPPSLRNFMKSFTSNLMNNRTVGLGCNGLGSREFNICLSNRFFSLENWLMSFLVLSRVQLSSVKLC